MKKKRGKNSVVKKMLTLVLALSMILGAIPVTALAAGQGEELEECERQTINFNREWKFIRQDVENAQAEDFNDSYWYNIGLPHDFSIPYWQETTHYTGYGWYRKTFTVDSDWLEKQIYLDFEGVFHTAEFYINGVYVDTHRGGYTGFEIDITDYVKAGENVVAIRVNNVWDATLAPRCGEHMFTGGIYRDVNLVITSPVHVTWYGTFVQTPDISAEKSNVRMQTEIKNDSEVSQRVKVVSEIYDAEENLVYTIESAEQTLAAGEIYNFDDYSSDIQKPHLWSVDDPYMYKVLTDVLVDGKSVDQYETPLGFRWVEWTEDQGFFLNGEHVWLNGANAHQDHAGWGNAVTTEALGRDVETIKEAGMNFIRGSHYPHSPAYAQACDEQGILFWSEAPFWGTASGGEGGTKGNSEDYKADSYPTVDTNGERAAFEQSCLDAVRDMIRVNRNHPSIIVWSMGNEVFFGANHDLKKELISKMAAYAKELDPTRATAMGGTQRGGYDKLENVDIAGYNGDGAKMEEYQNPGVANMVSEYASHTGNRPDSYKAYYGDVATGSDGLPIQQEWRSGIALWCAFHHGSIASRSYGDMGFIDYYRLPLQTWYYYRKLNTGVEPESSVSGTAAKLSLEASDTTISNDGTQDSHIIVTVQDENGVWVNATPEVTLEVVDGPGIFPTGKTMTFEPGDSMRDGKAAIEFRSYYAGVTTIKAYAEGLEPAVIQITITGEGEGEEPDISTMYGTFMSDGGYVPNPIEEPTLYQYVDYEGSPLTVSSGEDSRLNVLDGDADTEWTAEESGSGQWLYFELEHGGMSLYKARLTFKGKVYPYKIQYKKMNIDEDEWIDLVSYNADTVQARPQEESFYGTYMRYFRIEFTDVPEDEYANLAEISLYGLRAETDGYETGYQYLSDTEWESAEGTVKQDQAAGGGTLNIGGTKYQKGLGMQADSEVTYNLDGKYARFQCTVGIDNGAAGTSDATIRVYGDNQLMYEKKLTGKQETFSIDVSVSKVKELRLTTEADTQNIANQADWVDAKLIGALRDISADGENLTVQYFGNTETLVPGKEYEVSADFTNKAEGEAGLAAALALYSADGDLVSADTAQAAVAEGGSKRLKMSLEIPEEIPVGSYVKFFAWKKDSLAMVTETVTASRVAGDPEKDKYPEQPGISEDDGYWVTMTGDEVTKSGTGWDKWTPADGSVSGYETYTTNWQEAWIEQEFTGSRVKVFAKKDGSQKGAKIYIDGELAAEISTNASPDVYEEAFDSGKLDFGVHTVKIVPTGKFGFDCIQYYTEEVLADPPALEDGYEYVQTVYVYGDGTNSANESNLVDSGNFVKTGEWKYWTPSAGTSVKPQAGYETYIDSYTDSSLKLTFTGVQAALCAKVDGSKKGAEVYIDGELIESVNTNGTPDAYTEVFASGLLPYGVHTIEIKPTGKFGFDYISFYTGKPEDRTELLSLLEECGTLDEADYVSGWNEFQNAMKQAEIISRKPGYTQNDIDHAAAVLTEARKGLVFYVERDEAKLKALIGESLDLICRGNSQSAGETKEEFTETLLYAVSVWNAKGVEQGEVDQTAETLETVLVDLKAGGEVPDYLEKAREAQAAAEAAQKAAEAAQGKASEAQTAAEAAKREAEAAQEKAETAATAAEAAKEAAENAANTAGIEKEAAEAAKKTAEEAKTAAEEAQREAGAAQLKAEEAKTACETAQKNAENARIAAEAAQENAEKAQSAAERARDGAVEAAVEAETYALAAETSKNQAEQAKKDVQSARDTALAAQSAAEAARRAVESQTGVAEAARAAAEAARDIALAAQKGAEEAKEKAEVAQKAAEAVLREAQDKAAATLEAAEKKLQEAQGLCETMRAALDKAEFTSSTITLRSAKSTKKKQAKLVWKKAAGAEGYVIQYAANGKFKKAKTITVKGGDLKQKTLKNLKGGKKYYVRIRAYKTVEGKKIYTKYSKKITVKVKA